MNCKRHPNSGTIWLGDKAYCYGCYCEQFDYCPLCGVDWEHHPPEGEDCRKEIEMSKAVLLCPSDKEDE